MVQFRSDLNLLEPYVPGLQPEGPGWIKLNTNESGQAPPAALAALSQIGPEALCRYPEPTARPLRQALAKHFNRKISQVVVGNGSDDILNLLIRALCQPGQLVLSTDPAYSLYRVLAATQGAKYLAIPCLAGFALDLPAICVQRPAITLITSPNNPAGTAYPAEQIARICQCGHNLVVVDEAYAEFSDHNTLELLDRYPNLAVVRTFSKAYGLAGLRVGYLLGPESLCDAAMAIKDSYNVSGAAQIAALAAIADQGWARNMWAEVRQRRQALIDQLSKIPSLRPHPSQANFVLVDCGPHNAQEVYAQLLERKILVRYLGELSGAENAIRITIGSEPELSALVEQLWRICRPR